MHSKTTRAAGSSKNGVSKMTGSEKAEALASEWSERIVKAYFETAQPLPEASDVVALWTSIYRDIEMQALTSVAPMVWLERINKTIEAWEAFTSVHGSRIARFDPATGELSMERT